MFGIKGLIENWKVVEVCCNLYSYRHSIILQRMERNHMVLLAEIISGCCVVWWIALMMILSKVS
jgi:hypothetical protein